MLTDFCNLEIQVTLFASLQGYIFSVLIQNGKIYKMKVNSKSISSIFPVALFSCRDRFLAMLVHRHLSISAKVRHLLITPLHGTLSWHDSEKPMLSNLLPSVVKWSELTLWLCLRTLKNVVCSELEKTMTLIFQPNVTHRASLLKHCRCWGLRSAWTISHLPRYWGSLLTDNNFELRVGGSVKTQLFKDRNFLVWRWRHVSAVLGHLQVINTTTFQHKRIQPGPPPILSVFQWLL